MSLILIITECDFYKKMIQYYDRSVVKKAVLQDVLALKDIPIGTHLNKIINVNGVKLQYMDVL